MGEGEGEGERDRDKPVVLGITSYCPCPVKKQYEKHGDYCWIYSIGSKHANAKPII